MSKLIDQIEANTSTAIKRYVERSFDIADRIHQILLSKKQTQKDLAKALGKRESEISKWLSGTHNVTLKTISKIEEVLEEDIIFIHAPQTTVLQEPKPTYKRNKK